MPKTPVKKMDGYDMQFLRAEPSPLTYQFTGS